MLQRSLTSGVFSEKRKDSEVGTLRKELREDFFVVETGGTVLKT